MGGALPRRGAWHDGGSPRLADVQPVSTAARAAETLAREGYGRLLAWLMARSQPLAAAEDALSEAFAAALASWPRDGVPEKPEAWLLTTARRRLADQHRLRTTAAAALPTLRLAGDEQAPDSDHLPDHRLALLLACAGPAVEPAARAALEHDPSAWTDLVL